MVIFNFYTSIYKQKSVNSGRLPVLLPMENIVFFGFLMIWPSEKGLSPHTNDAQDKEVSESDGDTGQMNRGRNKGGHE